MKVCHKCGRRHSDTSIVCTDCGEVLGPPITPEEVQVIENAVRREIEIASAYNDDPFTPTLLEKVLAYSSMGLCLVLAILFVVFWGNLNLASVMESIFSLLFFGGCIVSCLFSRQIWEFEKFRLHFKIHDADLAEPSGAYWTGRGISIYVTFILALVCLVAAIVHMINPTEGLGILAVFE